MFFTWLVLLSAFLIESIGTYVSVLGLAALFSANPIIIVLSIALDLGKITTVSFLYRHWNDINIVMKTYMTVAAVVLMTITSAGAFGFLSGEFQHAIAGTNSQAVIISALEKEQGRLQHRKEEIDRQVAQLAENNVRGRTQLLKQFGPELAQINGRLVDIDRQLPELKVESIKKNVEVGPIIYIAQAFDTTPEAAVKWVILIIIFVFDPLAVALLIAGNYLLRRRQDQKLKDQAERVEKFMHTPIQPHSHPNVAVDISKTDLGQPPEVPLPIIPAQDADIIENNNVILKESHIEPLVAVPAETAIDHELSDPLPVIQPLSTPLSPTTGTELSLVEPVDNIIPEYAENVAPPTAPDLTLTEQEHRTTPLVEFNFAPPAPAPTHQSVLHAVDIGKNNERTDVEPEDLSDSRHQGLRRLFDFYAADTPSM